MLVTNTKPETISLAALLDRISCGDECPIVAYKSRTHSSGRGTIRVLKLHKGRWGFAHFISPGSSGLRISHDQDPQMTYVTGNDRDTIANCMETGRDVHTFTDSAEFLHWILDAWGYRCG